jgi:hypothetical protein
MTSDRLFYGLAKFPQGSRVRVAPRRTLEEFLATWRFHHKLQHEQLAYAAQVAEVEEIFMYHGGDILYKLVNLPGIWHQHLLESA